MKMARIRAILYAAAVNEPTLFQLAREPLVVPPIEAAIAAQTLLPHRGSWLLIDAVTGFDRSRGLVQVHAAGSPKVDGHFPAEPIYPGVLLVEIINQASLCLLGLLGEPTTARLIRILGAEFLRPVRPSEAVSARAGLATRDSLKARAYGQLLVGDDVRATAIVEVACSG
jgi:3-hydroxyacyl-[acyl-carrier-protein] dehydratase